MLQNVQLWVVLLQSNGDKIYVTSDNPRTEDPVQIVKDVEVGVKEALRDGTSYEVIVDRREAINHAIHDAKAGDIVIIAGNGPRKLSNIEK